MSIPKPEILFPQFVPVAVDTRYHPFLVSYSFEYGLPTSNILGQNNWGGVLAVESMQIINWYMLIGVVHLSNGDHGFEKAIAGLMSHAGGQPVSEEQFLEEISYNSQDAARLRYEDLPSPISTYANPKVNTSSGEVEGITNGQAHVFYEIPYAEPPIGALRFQPPQSIENPKPIDGTTNTGIRCPQVDRSCLLPAACKTMKEDCLVLNVFVPRDVDLVDVTVSSLPVMIYFHRGLFINGHGSVPELEASELAAVTNMIVVTLNYRLGALGFLVHKEAGESDISGNQGLKDQQMAMQWVQDNIEKFGGDKTRVTISGHSSGAQSVMFHTLSSTSKPLYNSAIQQSGPAVFPYQTPEESLGITNILLTSLSCNGSLTERSCLMTVDADTLTSSQTSVRLRILLNGDEMGMVEPFRPIIDGVEFTDTPLHLYRDGKWNSDKDMIVGVVMDEMETMQYYLPQGLEYSKIFFMLDNYGLFGEETGDIVIQKYEEDYPPSEGENWENTLSIEMTHFFFVCPSRALARFASATATGSAKVYFYAYNHTVLDETCVASRNETESCYYARHASDIEFLFRTRSNFSTNDQLVGDQLATYWGSFVRTGDPSNELDTPLGDFTDWPIYTHTAVPPDNPWKNILIKAPNSEVIRDFEEDICDFWDSIGYYMDAIPLPTEEPTTKATTTTRPESTTSSSSVSRSSVYLIGVLYFYALNMNFY